MRPRGSRFASFVTLAVAVAAASLTGIRCDSLLRTPVDPGVVASFEELVAHLSGLPGDALAPGARGIRTSLVQKVENARAAYLRGQACTAANQLGAYLNHTRALRQGRRLAVAEDLNNRGRVVQTDVLGSVPAGQPCAGFERVGREPAVEIAQSDNERFRASVSFGAPRTWTVEAGGDLFTQVEIPGVETATGQAGLPAVPVLRRLLAVPRGALVSMVATPLVAGTLELNLYPVQLGAADQVDDSEEPPPPETFEDPPFVKDEDAYASDALFPPEIVSITRVGAVRDLELAQVEVASGQYNPRTQVLTLFEAVEFEAEFQGGTGAFVTEATLSPFESAREVYAEAVLNAREVLRFVEPLLPVFPCFGEELLILTHPDFRAAADDLADWKRDKGISTSVFEVSDGAGPGPDTNEEIDDLIEERYGECLVRPSYVLLMGDAEFIEPFYVGTAYSAQTGSDYRYATLDDVPDPDLLPDFALGRIPVDTLAQAQTVVDKIIDYESTPPLDASFYANASLVSQFQCCRSGGQVGRTQRGFIEVSELVRNEMLGEGYTVERIYTETVDDDYTDDATPRRYYNGTLLPAALGAGSGFAWDGDTQDIIDAYNDGRFLILHRDHGWWDGWVNPLFTKTNVTNDLNNGVLQPVVFSVNCASGLFDNETNPGGEKYPTANAPSYWAERILRLSNGGAVGVIGDTRDSNTWANNAMTRGLFDAVWPGTLPAYGGAASIRRLGDILNHAKLYTLSQVGVAQTAGNVSQGIAEDELFLYHVLGDPTLEMWTANPNRFLLPREFLLELFLGRLRVEYAFEGAIITALQEVQGEIVPIGRAPVRGGEALLEYVAEPVAGVPIRLSASFENRISLLLTEPPGLVADQVNDVATGTSRGCGTPPVGLGSLFQGFTPSASPLAAVDLRLRAGGDFPAQGFESEIAVLAGAPDGQLLGTATAFVPGPQAPGAQLEVRFDLSGAPIAVAPGQPHFIEWVSPEQGGVILTWMVAESDTYPGGTAFDCAAGPFPDEDFIFTTYTTD